MGTLTPATAATTPHTRPPQPDVVTAATQPEQPRSGPGGSAYRNGDWRVSSGGVGSDAWYVFEPVEPAPRSAPVAIVMHGYYELAGYDQMYEFIRHTVRTGTIVVYPRYQTDVTVPCPGPFDIEPCITSAVRGIRGALQFLRADPHRVQPRLASASYFGFSFGGIITADIANRHAALHLPTPSVMFLDDPHDGGLTGTNEPALDDSLAGIPRSTLVVCHSGAQGVISEPTMENASCNALFPMLGHIPARNKSLVMVRPDRHGTPALGASHGVCMAPPGAADAYDWNFCWRTWDALRAAARHTGDRRDALGPSKRHRDLGAWSDGVAVTPLVVRAHVPLRP